MSQRITKQFRDPVKLTKCVCGEISLTSENYF